MPSRTPSSSASSPSPSPRPASSPSTHKEGDLVWARMKGFSWWPSRIIAPKPGVKPPAAAKQKPHLFCIFFGPENFAWVEEERIASYAENREKMKPAKISANLQLAIDRIEEALREKNRLEEEEGEERPKEVEATEKKEGEEEVEEAKNDAPMGSSTSSAEIASASAVSSAANSGTSSETKKSLLMSTSFDLEDDDDDDEEEGDDDGGFGARLILGGKNGIDVDDEESIYFDCNKSPEDGSAGCGVESGAEMTSSAMSAKKRKSSPPIERSNSLSPLSILHGNLHDDDEDDDETLSRSRLLDDDDDDEPNAKRARRSPTPVFNSDRGVKESTPPSRSDTPTGFIQMQTPVRTFSRKNKSLTSPPPPPPPTLPTRAETDESVDAGASSAGAEAPGSRVAGADDTLEKPVAPLFAVANPRVENEIKIAEKEETNGEETSFESVAEATSQEERRKIKSESEKSPLEIDKTETKAEEKPLKEDVTLEDSATESKKTTAPTKSAIQTPSTTTSPAITETKKETAKREMTSKEVGKKEAAKEMAKEESSARPKRERKSAATKEKEENSSTKKEDKKNAAASTAKGATPSKSGANAVASTTPKSDAKDAKTSGKSSATPKNSIAKSATSTLKSTSKFASSKSYNGSSSPVMKKDKSTTGSKAASSSTPAKSSSTFSSKTAPSPLRFGFLGLGVMGSTIAHNLVKSGHDLVVWNRSSTKCREVVKAGASKGASPADVVASCDITFCCVSDSAALKAVVFGEGGGGGGRGFGDEVDGVLKGLSDGKGFVDMSTVDAETRNEVAEAVQARGGKFLEAPIFGSRGPAQFGRLTILSAGDKELFDECASCFAAIAKKAVFLGDVGNAGKLKTVLNLMDGVAMAGLAEAMALTEQIGLRHEDVLEVMESGSLDCDLIREKGREMLEGVFTPSIALKHQQKDLKLAVNMADEHHLPLITGAAANELFKRARAMGYDEHDNSAVYRAAQYNS